MNNETQPNQSEQSTQTGCGATCGAVVVLLGLLFVVAVLVAKSLR